MLPLEIAARGIELSEPAEAAIRERGAKLETFYDRIMACRIAVDMPRRRGTTGQLYNVRIDITIPGKEFVVKRKPHESLLTAIQEAFDAAERRLRRYAQRQRGEVKQHEEQPHGWVREMYPTAGYGFLEDANGTTFYFDERSVLDGAFGRLAVGSKVRFASERGDSGPQASTVVLVENK